jgi:hypothetical protein
MREAPSSFVDAQDVALMPMDAGEARAALSRARACVP